MKWIKDLHCFQKQIRPGGGGGEVSKFLGPCNHNNTTTTTIIISSHRYLQTQRGYLSPTSSSIGGGTCTTGDRERWPVKNVLWKSGMYSSLNENLMSDSEISPNIFRRRYGHSPNDHNLSRDWLVKLWVAEKKIKSSRRKRQRYVQPKPNRGTVFENLPSFQMPFGRLFSGAPVVEEKSNEQMKTIARQPPLSQPTIGFLEPTSLEEVKVAPLLARSNLLITRDIEWANLMLGFEQENRYAVVDACYPQSPVGFIREQSNLIARQLLRTRRPFIASITDAMGNELFRVRRPFWWITSTIYVEIDGKEIGVVHRRWHLWRRVYDLYLGKKQFAVVENPGFWHWTFTLQDIDGNTLAEIDRDWRGFGFELLTDAGQYVIRFGQVDPSTKTGPAVAVQDLEVTRPLTLSERAVAVALAVSLDNDYFSRHGGWGLPFIAVGE